MPVVGFAAIRFPTSAAMFLRIRLVAPLATAAVALAISLSASAQTLTPRYGIGMGTLLTTGDRLMALGFHARSAFPYNEDLSFAIDLGVSGFVLSGREGAAYYVDPLASAIVTLYPSNPRSPYVMAGFGGHVPVGSARESGDGGPTVHAGVGWVVGLQATSLYIEIDPALLIAKDYVDLLLPVRLGIVL